MSARKQEQEKVRVRRSDAPERDNGAVVLAVVLLAVGVVVVWLTAGQTQGESVMAGASIGGVWWWLARARRERRARARLIAMRRPLDGRAVRRMVAENEQGTRRLLDDIGGRGR